MEKHINGGSEYDQKRTSSDSRIGVLYVTVIRQCTTSYRRLKQSSPWFKTCAQWAEGATPVVCTPVYALMNKLVQRYPETGACSDIQKQVRALLCHEDFLWLTGKQQKYCY